MKHLFGFMGGFFSGLFATGGPIYVIIIQNEANDIKTFRATMFASLGLVTVMRIPILAFEAFLSWTNFTILYMCCLFYTRLIFR
jgi:uncharacterized membrane protein YfcA